MGKIKKYKNIVERFLSNESGQRFFNAAYSLGAAVVILGALFKILHLSGGNEMLCIGMGTEVLMFLLTAFDRPEAQYKWEDVFPVLGTNDPADRPDFSSGSGIVIGNLGGSTGGGNNGSGETQLPKVTAQEARSAVGIPQGIELSEADTTSLTESIAKIIMAAFTSLRTKSIKFAVETDALFLSLRVAAVNIASEIIIKIQKIEHQKIMPTARVEIFM